MLMTVARCHPVLKLALVSSRANHSLATSMQLWALFVALPVGWAFAWWGTALYWLAGILYAVQLRQLIAAESRAVPA